MSCDYKEAVTMGTLNLPQPKNSMLITYTTDIFYYVERR